MGFYVWDLFSFKFFSELLKMEILYSKGKRGKLSHKNIVNNIFWKSVRGKIWVLKYSFNMNASTLK